MESQVFIAEISELPKMLDWVRGCASEAGFKSGDVKKIEIALEEILVNVISYAYIDQSGTIEVLASWEPKSHLKFILKDRGTPFNPLLHEAIIDPAIPIEERVVGGLGLALTKQFIDTLSYKREGSYNVLTLRKNVVL